MLTRAVQSLNNQIANMEGQKQSKIVPQASLIMKWKQKRNWIRYGLKDVDGVPFKNVTLLISSDQQFLSKCRKEA